MSHVLSYKRAIYQDRLGTNIRKQLEIGAFSAGVTRLNSAHGVPHCDGSSTPAGAAVCSATEGASFSAYRVHTEDTLVIAQGAGIAWRNGDQPGCADGGGIQFGGQPVNVSSIVFYYEY